MRRILRWPVAIDGHDHPIGPGPVILVGAQGDRDDVCMVWTDEADDALAGVNLRPARVFATGQPLPENFEHVGSVQVQGPGLLPGIPGPEFVWHVMVAIGRRWVDGPTS